jgi:hypothetical protein
MLHRLVGIKMLALWRYETKTPTQRNRSAPFAFVY